MKAFSLNYFLYALLVLIDCACKTKVITDPHAYLQYMTDPEHGLAKEKTVAGLKFKVKYLPADYLAYNIIKEMTGLTAHQKDSVVKLYDNSVTFLMNIGPADNESFDVTRLGINDYNEFAERIEQMAFRAQDWMSIKAGNEEYRPGIARMENINALENSRNFIVVFGSEKNTAKDLRKTDLCFTYTDELFNTGTNKFIFKTADMQALPEFKF
jgi:hypothetical protein